MTAKINNLIKQLVCIALLIQAGLLQAQQSVDFQHVNIDLFRGKHNVSIPIYMYQSKHLTLPISLDYSPVDITSDDKSYYQPGWTGLGWNLAAGGVITRSVNGIPDETQQTTNMPAGNFYNNDPLYNPKKVKEKVNPTDEEVWYSTLYESGEDDFSFNFCGYSGSFIYYRGEWKFYSDVKFLIYYKTELDGDGINVLKEFTLEAPDGITYTFGHGSDAMAYSSYIVDGEKQSKTATSWYLTQIESPEGDQINLSYTKATYPCSYPITKKCILSASTLSTGPAGPYTEFSRFAVISTFPTTEQIKNLSVGNYDEKVYLSSISNTSNNVVVQFNNLPSTTITYPGLNSSYIESKLDNILLTTSDNADFKKFDLSYFESSTEPLKLKSIQESGIASNGSATPLPGYYQFGYVAVDNEVAPAVLNAITYPTGGSSSFEFEKNRYVTGITPDQSQGETSDGFRIKRQLSRSSSFDKAQITNYYYTIEFPELDPANAADNTTSGIKNRSVKTEQIADIRSDEKILLDGGWFFVDMYKMKSVTEYDCIHPSDLPNPTIKTIQLGYSSVWVIQSKDDETVESSYLGATNYQFTNYITNTGLDSDHPHLIFNNLNEIGKMTSCVTYNVQRNIINTTNYKYEHGPETRLDRYDAEPVTYINDPYLQVVTKNTWGGCSVDYSECKLAKKTTCVNGFTTTTTYTNNYTTNNLTEVSVIEPTLNYNSIGADAIATTIASDLKYYNTTTTSYTYLSDFPDNKPNYSTSYDPGDGQHIWHHIKNAPVEKIVKRNGKIIAAELTTYNYVYLPTSSSLYPTRALWARKPDQVYVLEISSPLYPENYIVPTFEGSMLGSNSPKWVLGSGSLYKLRTTFDQYDTHGNLLQYHNEGDVNYATYYDTSQQPIVVAKNCTYNVLNSQITGSSLSSPADFCKLRKLLPSAQITSYVYNSLFGITSITSPNGISTYKEYDVFGRMKCIKDEDGKILQTVDYNFNIK